MAESLGVLERALICKFLDLKVEVIDYRRDWWQGEHSLGSLDRQRPVELLFRNRS